MEKERKRADKFFVRNHQDARVRLKVDAGCAPHDFEAAHGNILLVGEAEADEVQDHFCCGAAGKWECGIYGGAKMVKVRPSQGSRVSSSAAFFLLHHQYSTNSSAACIAASQPYSEICKAFFLGDRK